MNYKDILCIIIEIVRRMMDDGNVFKCYVAGYVVKVCEIIMEAEIKIFSQATVKVYIIQSSRERYFIKLLN